MSRLDFLIGADGILALALYVVAAWLLWGAYDCWKRGGVSDQICVLLGYGTALFVLGHRFMLAMVVRQLDNAGRPITEFFDTWPYAVTMIFGAMALLLALRGLTARKHGEWPWVACASFIVIGVFWDEPSHWLGELVYWIAVAPH